jgi:hypothetical protein
MWFWLNGNILIHFCQRTLCRLPQWCGARSGLPVSPAGANAAEFAGTDESEDRNWNTLTGTANQVPAISPSAVTLKR